MKNKIDNNSYSLGIFIGEYIIVNYLPRLSCHSESRNAIQITWGEYKEQQRLSDIWFNEYIKNKNGSDNNWNNLKKI